MTVSPPLPTPNPWRRWAIGLGLIVLLIAVYFLTYRGYAVSRDEWFLFDATESMARRGTLEQNYEFDAFPPISLDAVNPPPADTEPLQPVLASVLFLIAQALPGIGLAHTVWLFNIVITALTAGVVYAYGLGLGYRARVAALTALVYGLGTIAWPYSRTYFREPLFTLLALLTVYLVMIVRHRLAAGKRPWFAWIALALAFAGALFSKEVSLLLIPAIIVEALPSRLKNIRFTRRTVFVILGIILFLGALALIILNADTLFNISRRYAFTARMEQARSNISGASAAMRGYMFSPGRSLWLFSPILLLGFFGWRRLIREGRRRQIAVPLVMLITFVIGYALVRGEDQWTGGLGWGARYLVPVTPFIALWLLPIFASLLEHRAAWWQYAAALALFLVSAGIQVLASLISIQQYYDSLTEQERFAYDDIWTFRKSPIPGYLDLLGDRDVDWAWQYAVGQTWLLPVLCAVLAIVALGWIIWWVRRPEHLPSNSATFVFTAGSLVLVTAITLGGGLYAIRKDMRYSGDFQPTLDLLYQLKPELAANDVIVLNDPTYAEFFMNYYKLDQPTVYTLPAAPGERYSPEQQPKRVSVYPDELVNPSETLLFAHYAQQTDRLWLVINSSSFIPWSTRPVEYYLARHYFPVYEVAPDDLARA
ncbi:MAG: hypothetical protein JXA10_00625, partial [Anaerolineae bacterium]|nr:hypothetical protein [Anaerolineae bacterium]